METYTLRPCRYLQRHIADRGAEHLEDRVRNFVRRSSIQHLRDQDEFQTIPPLIKALLHKTRCELQSSNLLVNREGKLRQIVFVRLTRIRGTISRRGCDPNCLQICLENATTACYTPPTVSGLQSRYPKVTTSRCFFRPRSFACQGLACLIEEWSKYSRMLPPLL